MTFNKHFGKLKDDHSIEYGPIPLNVVTCYHEEWDESVYDETTGEPTGETVHRNRDWSTVKVKIHPSPQDYIDMNYLPIVDSVSHMPHKDGYRIERTAEWEESGGTLRPKCIYVEVPPQPVYISKSKVEAYIDQIGKTDIFTQWLNSKASYIGGWMRGGDMLEYEPNVHGTDLESLLYALDISQECIPNLIEQVKA